MKRAISVSLSVMAALPAFEAELVQNRQQPSDLTQLAIEDLMRLEVTTASRKAEALSHVAAAVYVITQEDIRRSGATNIPDLLRMVPGVQVAQVDGNKWAVSARGFNGLYANKLLVLIDGRSVYTPLFSGVYWDVQDTLLEDVERIEVIRGPGGSLWGANAVNGVINIITKNAADTQGDMAVAGAGDRERGFGSFRHGGRLKGGGHFRVYGKYFDRDELEDAAAGGGAGDQWDVLRGGFRFDWGDMASGKVTVDAGAYDGDIGSTSTLPILTPPFSENVREVFTASGAHVLGRWHRSFSDRSETSVQVYYDRTTRNRVWLDETRDTVDLEFQRRTFPGKRHDLMWGGGYRRTSDQTRGSFAVSFAPASRTDNLFSAFVQDEIALKNQLRLTLGSKFEHNDYTGFEVQPSVRLIWKPDERRALWAAIARAVRTPNRAEHDSMINQAAFPGGAV